MRHPPTDRVVDLSPRKKVAGSTYDLDLTSSCLEKTHSTAQHFQEARRPFAFSIAPRRKTPPHWNRHCSTNKQAAAAAQTRYHRPQARTRSSASHPRFNYAQLPDSAKTVSSSYTLAEIPFSLSSPLFFLSSSSGEVYVIFKISSTFSQSCRSKIVGRAR